MTVFMHDGMLDRILNENARSPIIPFEDQILQVGIGEKFIEKYKNSYGIKKHEIYNADVQDKQE